MVFKAFQSPFLYILRLFYLFLHCWHQTTSKFLDRALDVRCDWRQNCGLFSQVASIPPQHLSLPMMPVEVSNMLFGLLFTGLASECGAWLCHKFTSWNQKMIEESWQRPNLLQIQADSGTYTLQIIGSKDSKEIRPTPRSCLGGCIFAISFCLLGLWYRILSLSLQSQISQISSISSKTLRVAWESMTFEKPSAIITWHSWHAWHRPQQFSLLLHTSDHHQFDLAQSTTCTIHNLLQLLRPRPRWKVTTSSACRLQFSG